MPAYKSDQKFDAGGYPVAGGIDLRVDAAGRPDDLVSRMPAMVRLERLDDGLVWVAIYPGADTSRRLALYLRSETPITITVEETPDDARPN